MVLGDLAGVLGDRFIQGASTPGQTELTLVVTEIVAGDQTWVDQLNRQLAGGRFVLAADPGIRAREES